MLVMTETLSIKVPGEVKLRLKAVAQARRTKPSALLREALNRVLEGEASGEGPSCHELCADLFDDLEIGGPRDLATNPKHLAKLGG